MKTYKCIGLTETVVRCWKHRFKIGELYKVAINLPASDRCLFLSDGTGDPANTFFVDKDQFEECTK